MSGLTRTLSGGAGSQNRTGPAPTPVNGESIFSSVMVHVLLSIVDVVLKLHNEIYFHFLNRLEKMSQF